MERRDCYVPGREEFVKRVWGQGRGTGAKRKAWHKLVSKFPTLSTATATTGLCVRSGPGHEEK